MNKPDSSPSIPTTTHPDFPDEVLEKILSLIDSNKDRNSVSLVSKNWYHAERWTRSQLFVRTCYPVCPNVVVRRFPRITRVVLQGNHGYSDLPLCRWGGSNDVYTWLVMIAKAYPFLDGLIVNSMTVSDDSLELLAQLFPRLECLALPGCRGFSDEGLNAIASHLCNHVFIPWSFSTNFLQTDGNFPSHGFIQPFSTDFLQTVGNFPSHVFIRSFSTYFLQTDGNFPWFHIFIPQFSPYFLQHGGNFPRYSLLRHATVLPEYDEADELEAAQILLSRREPKPKDPNAESLKQQFVEMRRRERKLGKPMQTRMLNSKQAMARGSGGARRR